VFGSPELFDDIPGITDHGLDVPRLWWRTQLSDLHFFLVLQRGKEKALISMIRYRTQDTVFKSLSNLS